MKVRPAMCMEIEAKVKVDSLDAVAARLVSIKADHRDRVRHIDTYYDDSAGLLIDRGCGLRLRRQIGPDGEKVILTYKGPKQKGRFKKRREIEVEIADFDAMDTILTELGCQKKLVIEKRRAFWRFKGCAICLDEIPLLGCFVEVEGPEEEVIGEVLEDMALGGLEHINKGYAGLIKRKLKEMGSDKREVFFEVE